MDSIRFGLLPIPMSRMQLRNQDQDRMIQVQNGRVIYNWLGNNGDVLTVSIPVLPLGAADWLMRVTPTAAFAVEQAVVQYPQVDDVYAPAYGYYHFQHGRSVLCAWTAVFLALAVVTLNRRDA